MLRLNASVLFPGRRSAKMPEDEPSAPSSDAHEARSARLSWVALRNALVRIATWPHNGLLLILAGVTAVYAPTLHESFHGDDFVAFTEFKSQSFWHYSKNVFEFKDANFYWRPLGKISHDLLFQIFGLDPFSFRVFSLVIFLLTVTALYFFCVREGLGRAVALGAALIFGLVPNHVVSVTWVTNSSRLMAVLFSLTCLLFLQTPSEKRKVWHEAAAFLFLLLAALSDETALALAPVPFLYVTFVHRERFRVLNTALRLAVYAGMVAALMPLQFKNNLNDEPRLWSYGFGPHMLKQLWTLASQLVLPLTSAGPLDVMMHDIPTAQWAAGLMAIALGGVALVFGSRWLKFLTIWTGLALAPFTLWNLNYTSPRYVYMAAVPYAVILSWGIVSAVPLVVRLLRFRIVVGMALATGLTAAIVVSTMTTLSRDAAWGRQTDSFRPLQAELKSTLKDVPKNSRIVIYYGPWTDFWATSVVQTMYGDRSIRVTNVPSERVESGWPRLRKGDIILYYLGDHFVETGLAGAPK